MVDDRTIFIDHLTSHRLYLPLPRSHSFTLARSHLLYLSNTHTHIYTQPHFHSVGSRVLGRFPFTLSRDALAIREYTQ